MMRNVAQLIAILAILALIVLAAACGESPGFSPASMPGVPPGAKPYLVCRTKHTEDDKQFGSSPDYDITCWRPEDVATPTPTTR